MTGSTSQTSSSVKIAVFDLDWTLLEEISAETLWVLFCIKHRIVPGKLILISILRLFLFLPFGINRAILKNRYYLKGLKRKTAIQLMDMFYEDMLKSNLSAELLIRMKKLKSSGYRIFLLSATLDFILEYLVDKLDADAGISSVLEINGEEYTGHIIGVYPYYHGKVRCLEKMCSDLSVDFENSFAFGDTWADLPLLSKFGHPVAVHPDRILRTVARKNQWEIVTRYVRRKSWPVRYWLNWIYRPACRINTN